MIFLSPERNYSMAGGPQTQWKNHVKFYAIKGPNVSRRKSGWVVEKDQAWPGVIALAINSFSLEVLKSPLNPAFSKGNFQRNSDKFPPLEKGG
jgi:hypothetical protein